MTDSISHLYQFDENQSPISMPSSFKSKKKIKKSQNFSIEDDMVLIELVRAYGPKFHMFPKYFRKKSLNQLKNRYYKKLRYDQMDKDLDQSFKKSESRAQLQVQELTRTIKGLEVSEDISSLLQNFVRGIANIISQL